MRPIDRSTGSHAAQAPCATGASTQFQRGSNRRKRSGVIAWRSSDWNQSGKFSSFRWGCLLLTVTILVPGVRARSEIITLKCGLQLQGRYTKITSLNQNPFTPFKPAVNVDVAKIVLVDDNLRRTFVSSNQVRAGGLAADSDGSLVKIRIPKRVAQGGRRISTVGSIIQITPFDEFGNRIFSMQGVRGRTDIVQGITEITPRYVKVEGLQVRKNAYAWDMRVQTASIPRRTLTQILLRNIDQANVQDRLRVVTLYIQAKRYEDALVELNRIIADFPDVKDLEKQRQRLYQLVTTDLIREIKLRRDAGQHAFAKRLLSSFPKKDVAGELLLQIGDLLAEYDKATKQAKRVFTLLAEHKTALASHRSRAAIDAITMEIQKELNLNNLDRMADYLRLADDTKMTADQKLSLAISGWLLGSGAGIENLVESLSLVEVRMAARDYLRAAGPGERMMILQRLRELEGSSPGNLAKIIAHMKPAIETEMPQEGIPGLLELAVPGTGQRSEFRYYIQLPLEYDPYRRYPCVVTLNGTRSTPLSQIDWWAGPYDPAKRLRIGQATRHGYIVIAPVWTKKGQTHYQYSLSEHVAVLRTLRDACRRFSIDTDRVFLSGYSMGGDAAWDIGLAHPDLWAGVLPIVATAGKYISRYWPNGRKLPMYFVAGQLDGNKIATNARDLDRYLEKSRFDVMYVEYRGRGHENFHDEILRMFEWMGLHRRDFFPKQFECVSMRPWDQFFWWLELRGFPERSMVLPLNWPQAKAKEAKTDARTTATNGIRIKTAATDVTIWLSPELLDFDRRISVNGKIVEVTPSAVDLLEDVRTRSDRQHPFWAKILPRDAPSTVGRRR